MSKEKGSLKTNEAQNVKKSHELEYAFEPVPEKARKSTGVILLILTGYTISLSNFVTGAVVGSRMPFKDAVLSCLSGNLILILVATALGVIAANTGLSTSVLARKSLGMRSSAIISILIAISAVNWIAVNADTFANLIATNFDWWPLSVAITSIIVVAIWAQSAIRGVQGLEFVSKLGVPAALVLTVASAIAIGKVTGYDQVYSFQPATDKMISFAEGSTSFVGAWIFGCIVTPDVTRYAKHKKAVMIGAPIAVALGLFGLELIGIMTAQATGENSFVAATAALGLGLLVFFAAIFCVWTTQDNNIYSASLALQNIFVDTKLEGKMKHSWLAVIVAVASAAFAAAGAVKYLLPVVQSLSILLPCIPGMMIAEAFVVKRSKENQSINWLAMISWAISAWVGYVALQKKFLIPAIVSMLVAFVLYIVLSKLFDKNVNKTAVPNEVA